MEKKQCVCCKKVKYVDIYMWGHPVCLECVDTDPDINYTLNLHRRQG